MNHKMQDDDEDQGEDDDDQYSSYSEGSSASHRKKRKKSKRGSRHRKRGKHHRRKCKKVNKQESSGMDSSSAEETKPIGLNNFKYLGGRPLKRAYPKKCKLRILRRVDASLFRHLNLVNMTTDQIDMLLFICCNTGPFVQLADLGCKLRGQLKKILSDEAHRLDKISPRYSLLAEDLSNTELIARQLGWEKVNNPNYKPNNQAAPNYSLARDRDNNWWLHHRDGPAVSLAGPATKLNLLYSASGAYEVQNEQGTRVRCDLLMKTPGLLFASADLMAALGLGLMLWAGSGGTGTLT